MNTPFGQHQQTLYDEAKEIISQFLRSNKQNTSRKVPIPAAFKESFFQLIDQVNLGLMADQDNFYGYFLFQMSRDLRFDMTSPTGVNFQAPRYVLYFNPVIFLTLTEKQMESTIKHEILHVLSLHLLRARNLTSQYGTLATNIAMDIVVNTYLDFLPPYATTLASVNAYYNLKLLPFETFEYYAEKVQAAIDLLATDEKGAVDDSRLDEAVETKYEPQRTHDLWQESSEIDAKTFLEFTEKLALQAQKGTPPAYILSMLEALAARKGELPWNLYLKQCLGTIASTRQKTTARRNRRQPDRLDLRGELRSYKAKIAVALDISGSISDEEFQQAMKEVLAIVKNYKHEITLVECDDEIRRVYPVKTAKDLKERLKIRGATRFTPVFDYANQHKINLLIYFTDGQGETSLQTQPKDYKTLWILSGNSKGLSLKTAYGAVKQLKPVENKDTTVDPNDVAFRDGYSMNSQEKNHI
ncbi:MAG: VWA-like domain-containing protein [Sporomusaceae bacterium]|nr:VWA-like domain-containing protein [Sporomusaceae bacterium]